MKVKSKLDAFINGTELQTFTAGREYDANETEALLFVVDDCGNEHIICHKENKSPDAWFCSHFEISYT